jgi:uncharacterized protein
MSLASRLYQLQTIELQLREQRRRLQETLARLNHNEELTSAEAELSTIEARLTAAQKHQRQLEWEVEDLQAKTKGLNEKLYGGSVRNPKELLSLEQDVQSVKRHLAGKEEALLQVMDDTESVQAAADTLRQRVAALRQAWEQEREVLEQLRQTVEQEVARLTEARQSTRRELGEDTALRYDQIAKAKGIAVVKVEQGRCKGCNLTVPAGLWQRARAGEMVECGSCGRIIYVE